jgi:hypothetical protein
MTFLKQVFYCSIIALRTANRNNIWKNAKTIQTNQIKLPTTVEAVVAELGVLAGSAITKL